jgi:hypothetical protein
VVLQLQAQARWFWANIASPVVVGELQRNHWPKLTSQPQPPDGVHPQGPPLITGGPLPGAVKAVSTAWQFASVPPLASSPAKVAVAVSKASP